MSIQFSHTVDQTNILLISILKCAHSLNAIAFSNFKTELQKIKTVNQTHMILTSILKFLIKNFLRTNVYWLTNFVIMVNIAFTLVKYVYNFFFSRCNFLLFKIDSKTQCRYNCFFQIQFFMLMKTETILIFFSAIESQCLK